MERYNAVAQAAQKFLLINNLTTTGDNMVDMRTMHIAHMIRALEHAFDAGKRSQQEAA